MTEPQTFERNHFPQMADAGRPALGRTSRLRAALPAWRGTVLGALAWGIAMVLSAQAALWLAIGAETAHFWKLSALWFGGAAVAWPFALYLIRLVSLRRGAEVWFAASVVFLSLGTIAVTSGFYALIYRIFYAQWHGSFLTRLWVIQFVFTTASALYQFAVMGLRLYLPLGAVFLFLFALLLARAGCRNRNVDWP